MKYIKVTLKVLVSLLAAFSLFSILLYLSIGWDPVTWVVRFTDEIQAQSTSNEELDKLELVKVIEDQRKVGNMARELIDRKRKTIDDFYSSCFAIKTFRCNEFGRVKIILTFSNKTKYSITGLSAKLEIRDIIGGKVAHGNFKFIERIKSKGRVEIVLEEIDGQNLCKYRQNQLEFRFWKPDEITELVTVEMIGTTIRLPTPIVWFEDGTYIYDLDDKYLPEALFMSAKREIEYLTVLK